MQPPPPSLNFFNSGAGFARNLEGGGRATELNKFLIGQIPKIQIDVVHYTIMEVSRGDSQYQSASRSLLVECVAPR